MFYSLKDGNTRMNISVIKGLLRDPVNQKRALKWALAVGLVGAGARLFLVPYLLNKRKKAGNKNGTMISVVRVRKPNFDRKFVKELKQLLKIMVPGLISKESLILFLHSSNLICR